MPDEQRAESEDPARGGRGTWGRVRWLLGLAMVCTAAVLAAAWYIPGLREWWSVSVIDPLPLLAALGELKVRGEDVADLAAAFHESVAEATASVADRVSEATGIRTVALGGGVFQNARLLVSVTRRLESNGFTVLIPRQLSPNDGAISYGQAAVAAALIQRESC